MRAHLILCLPAILLAGTACTKDDIDRSGFARAAIVAGDVATDSIMPWVERLAAARAADKPVDAAGFSPGHLFPVEHLTRDASVGLVARAFESMGYNADTLVLGEGTQAAFNVFAEWRGTTHPDEVVLVGSHLDAFYAGADDNGSAVAAMLEAARAVRKHHFARTIRFISFDLEEFGSVGSTRYVKAGYARDVKSAIVLDLVGFASKEPGSQKNVMGIRLPDVGDYLLVIGNDDSEEITRQITGMGNSYGWSKLVGMTGPGDGAYFLAQAFMRSDHALFWHNGIPAVFLTDGANFRNPNYHLPSDLPETLDPVFLAGNTKALTAAIALLADVQP